MEKHYWLFGWVAYIVGLFMLIAHPVVFGVIAVGAFTVIKVEGYLAKRRAKREADELAAQIAEQRDWEENAIPVEQSSLAKQP
jgi:hypothetical protein